MSLEPPIVDFEEIKPPPPALSYVVELWNEPRTEPEQVVGRASGVLLARALFTAACETYAGRRVVLMRGETLLGDNG